MDYIEGTQQITSIDDTIKRIANQIPVEQVRDKVGLHFFCEKELSSDMGAFRQAIITFGAKHGAYGNSSASDDMTIEVAQEITKAINALREQIIATAIGSLKKRRKEIAQAIADDARKILETAGEVASD